MNFILLKKKMQPAIDETKQQENRNKNKKAWNDQKTMIYFKQLKTKSCTIELNIWTFIFPPWYAWDL